MKLLIALFSVFIISDECTQTKTGKPQNINNLKVSYQVISRGFFKEISFEDAQMMYSEDPNVKAINTFKLNKKEWSDVLQLVAQLNLDGLESLVAPTEKRLYDGAAHTTVSVVIDGKSYVSSSFDEGHPPAEIDALVNKMLTISEKYLQP
ncbi:hypothetical protein FJ651_04580 [Paucihalobacter ruber]|uniref:Uncharacterized protein n=1 Tax=Paucihalobacter ruber TaxID=2567861 RepID=A0A506PMG3_9FLAO|nr:hypothetical protein [Paucihalobacter ruber]TPV34814.1 hypothetical protein FJ651_04580 [Paucihalobacter ruber]